MDLFLDPLVSGNKTSENYFKTVLIDFGMSKISSNITYGVEKTFGRDKKFIQAPEILDGYIYGSFEQSTL